MNRLILELWLLPRNAAILVLHAYRKFISPLYGQVCRYEPSCSRYAVEAYQQRGFVVGTLLTAWRLLRCNPWAPGGIDDVPAPRQSRHRMTDRGLIRPAL